MIKRVGILLVIVMGLGLAACSSGSSPNKVDITITMSEFAFDPANIELHVGDEVTLHVVNSGALPHEVMFGRDVAMHDGAPDGYQTDMFQFAHVEPMIMEPEQGAGGGEDMHMDEDHTGFMVGLPAGSSEEGTMSFTVTEDMVGEWEMGCFENAGTHYTAGMVGTLTVKP